MDAWMNGNRCRYSDRYRYLPFFQKKDFCSYSLTGQVKCVSVCKRM